MLAYPMLPLRLVSAEIARGAAVDSKQVADIMHNAHMRTSGSKGDALWLSAERLKLSAPAPAPPRTTPRGAPAPGHSAS